MVKALEKIFLTAFFCSLSIAHVFAQDDPPGRAARLSYVSGAVSMEPAGFQEWAPAEVNRPFTNGDYLYTDQKATAELHLDSAVFRMGEVTSFGFLNLNDQVAQLKLTEGDIFFRVRNLAPSQVYEIDTPNAAINLLRDGVYRIHVDPNANSSFVVVREGQAEITGGGQAFTLNPSQSASLTGTDQLAYDVEQAPGSDQFDNWCNQRDARQMRARSAQYVPPSLIGSEDLDDYGDWNQSQEYGPVWYPSHVDAGWAPYHDGHWTWVEPWGWTWVDAAPWGFAPSHYGRWVYWHDRWGWSPGPVAVVYAQPIRPVYAPALVAWFGGSHWGVSVSVGGPSLGWVALGFGEVYTPSYHCSPGYFQHVNVYNTRVVNTVNITNVYKTVYVQHNTYNQTFVNARAPQAVMSMPASAMASGRAVRQAGAPVRQADFARMSNASVVAPPVAPTRQAVASQFGGAAAHPDPRFMSRQVIARSTPAPAPAPFAARQAYLQQHAGQVHDFAGMHQAVAQNSQPAPAVRQVQAARPVAVHTGQRFGNPPTPSAGQPAARPPAAPGQPAATGKPAVRPPAAPGQPAAAGRPAMAKPPTGAGQPALAGHGTPPNLQHQNGRPAAENGRPAAENGRPAAAQNAPAAAAPERPQPAYQRPQPAVSGHQSQPHPLEQRPAAERPAPERAAPERAAPERPAAERPAAVQRPPATPPSPPEPRRVEERKQPPPPPHPEAARPAAPPHPAEQHHEAPPKEKKEEEHKDKEKDKDK